MVKMSLLSVILNIEHRLHTHLRRKSTAALALRATADGQRPQPRHLILGERGEDAACFHLRALGYTVVARRWRSSRRSGDLDLVAWLGSTLVIVEVKTRTQRDISPAESQVDAAKQRILRQLASAYIAQFPARHRASIALRFDVLSVYLLATGSQFDHFPNAFALEDDTRRPH
jgi:putative endonuclease